MFCLVFPSDQYFKSFYCDERRMWKKLLGRLLTFVLWSSDIPFYTSLLGDIMVCLECSCQWSARVIRCRWAATTPGCEEKWRQPHNANFNSLLRAHFLTKAATLWHISHFKEENGGSHFSFKVFGVSQMFFISVVFKASYKCWINIMPDCFVFSKSVIPDNFSVSLLVGDL